MLDPRLNFDLKPSLCRRDECRLPIRAQSRGGCGAGSVTARGGFSTRTGHAALPDCDGGKPGRPTSVCRVRHGRRVLVVDLARRKVTRTIPLPDSPSGLTLLPDGQTLCVTAAAPLSRVCVVDVVRGRVVSTLPAGHTAMSPVLSPDGNTLFVCNRFNNDISVLDLAAKKELCRIAVRREPVAAAITPDGKYLLVANHLHHGRADTEHVAAVVSVIDPAPGRVVDELWLPNGSGSLNDIRISPDGHYAVVTHLLSRFALPTTQLDRGWMNTNAKTIIDPARMEVLNTVLLDSMDRGAAVP